MSATGFLAELARAGVAVVAEADGSLRCRGPRGAMTASLKQRIADHRAELLSSLNSTGPTPRTVALIVDASADEGLIPETCASCGTKEPIVVLTMSGGCADERPWRMCRSCWEEGTNWFSVTRAGNKDKNRVGWCALCNRCGHELGRKDFQPASARCPGCGAAS